MIKFNLRKMNSVQASSHVFVVEFKVEFTVEFNVVLQSEFNVRVLIEKRGMHLRLADLLFLLCFGLLYLISLPLIIYFL